MASVSEMGRPVIGARYCLPSTSQYTLQQTHRGSKDWSVIDANKAVIFNMPRYNTNSSGWIPKYETQLVDAQGYVLARIQEKRGGGGSTWKVLGGDGEILYSARRGFCGLIYWTTALKVFLASNLSENQPDYTVEKKETCGLLDYTILHGTQPLAEVEVHSMLFWRPTYTVTVNAGADCAFILLLVMIIEKRAQQLSRQRNNAMH